MTAAAGNYFSIMVNSVINPFYTTQNLTNTTATYSYSNYGTLVQGTSSTQSPIGYSSIAQLYTNYRVVKYRLEITANAATAADIFRVVASALGQEEQPSTAAGSMNLRVLEGQPFSKAMTVSSAAGMTNGTNTIVLEGYPYQDMGKTKADYMGEASTPVGSFPDASIRDYVGVFSQPLTGTNNAGICSMQLKLIQDVVFYDLVNQVN